MSWWRSNGAAAALVTSSAAQQRKTKNLVLVTADGLRWQDLFTGIDPLLMNQKDAGMTETGAPEFRNSLWKTAARGAAHGANAVRRGLRCRGVPGAPKSSG